MKLATDENAATGGSASSEEAGALALNWRGASRHTYCLSAAELRHLHSLRGLRELEIESSFDEQMQADCDELTVLRPPSAALPLLRSFSFSSRRFQAESAY